MKLKQQELLLREAFLQSEQFTPMHILLLSESCLFSPACSKGDCFAGQCILCKKFWAVKTESYKYLSVTIS